MFYYCMAYKKFNISSATLSSCVSKRDEIIKVIKDVEGSVNLRLSANQLSDYIATNIKKIESIESEIKAIQYSPSSYVIAPGIFNAIFREKKMTDAARLSIDRLREKRRHLDQEIGSKKGEIQYLEKFSSLTSFLEKLDKRIATLSNKSDSLRNLKNRAAQSDKEKRLIGAEVRKRLDYGDACPYCGGTLGGDPHADHIYPLSRGGHGVSSNMVMVCSSCNLKKSNLTLREFIIKFKLDRDEIESRLEGLGKRF